MTSRCQQCQQSKSFHGFTTVMTGAPMVVMDAGGVAGGTALALPVRPARIPAAAPPAASAPIHSHREWLWLTLVDATPGMTAGPSMYCEDITPARACSNEATMRIWNRPGRR